MTSGNPAKKVKLVTISLGISELQGARLRVLMQVTKKGRARLIREAIDAYFANYQIGEETLGVAETRLFRRRSDAAETSD